MTRDELIRLIRQEIRQAADVILAAKTRNSKGKFEDIVELYPDMPTFEARSTMRPYGLVSRAPSGTTSVVGRQSHHQGNRIVLGHRDDQAPDLDNEGDVMLYNASGAQIYLNGGKTYVGSRNATKGAARKTDPVKVTFTAGPTGSMAALAASLITVLTSPAGPLTVASVASTNLDITGVITDGSDNVLVED